MFNDKAFNLSILFSVAWHLFWISAICIVITPTVQPSDLYQEVDFLGPILEKTAFDLLTEQASAKAETLYARTTLFAENVYLKPKGPERKVLGDSMPDSALERFAFVMREYVKGKTETPFYFSEVRELYRKTEKSPASPLIDGPASLRGIIFRPGPISIPKGVYDNQDGYDVKLRFVLTADGIVRNVEPVISSGYPEIDLQAAEFLKKWRFAPSQLSGSKKDTAWGITTIKLKAK